MYGLLGLILAVWIVQSNCQPHRGLVFHKSIVSELDRLHDSKRNNGVDNYNIVIFLQKHISTLIKQVTKKKILKRKPRRAGNRLFRLCVVKSKAGRCLRRKIFGMWHNGSPTFS